MSERLETLRKARERMTDDRDAFAKTLAAPFDREKAERARIKFIETQVLIDAIDRALTVQFESSFRLQQVAILAENGGQQNQGGSPPGAW